MKILFAILILCHVYFDLSAQGIRPDDFYISKSGDTVRGKFRPGGNFNEYDNFKTLKGEKIPLNPDSILSYSIYLDNFNLRTDDPHYFYTRDWISIQNGFYEVYYKDSSSVCILTQKGGGFGPSRGGKYDVFFINRQGTLSKFFLATGFYNIAKTFLSDCPTISDILDQVPNEKNKTKTHKATLEDAAYIIKKYNECTKVNK